MEKNMNDDIIIKMISRMITEDKGEIPLSKSIDQYNIVESSENKIIIRIVGRGGEPYKDLTADYCRYVTSPKSGVRYLVAGNSISRDAIARMDSQSLAWLAMPVPYQKKNWLHSLRDFYKLRASEYVGRRPTVVPKFNKIMTIKAENVISITKPNQATA